MLSASDPSWAIGIGSSNSMSVNNIAVDSPGNSYIAGYFTGTVDFDPGPGTSNLTAPIPSGSTTLYEDAFVAKYTPTGGLAWARRFGGNFDDAANGVTVDSAGNVYATGFYRSNIDLNGDGIIDLTNSGGDGGEPDIFVAKYDPSGNLLWAKGMGGSGDDRGNAIAVDSAGDVITGGSYSGAPDMDPGPGTFTLPNVSDPNGQGFLSVLDSSGGFVNAWATGGWATAIAADTNGIKIGGNFFNTVDFDPGPGTVSRTSAGSSDIFLAQYSFSGTLGWVDTMGSPNYDRVNAIALDSGALYVKGTFAGTVDFDPGPGTTALTPLGNTDAFVARYNPADGSLGWVRQFGSASPEGSSGGIAVYVDPVTAAESVFATGMFAGTADFDPGPGVANLTSAGSRDAFIVKLDSAGNYVSAWRLGGPQQDFGAGIGVDGVGRFYATGFFTGTTDVPTGGTLTSPANGIYVLSPNPTLGEVSGHLFTDVNRDGLDNDGAAIPSGWSVDLFADANNDGIPDSTTPVATAVTSGNYGNFGLADVAPGNYLAAPRARTGWTQTSPVNSSGQPTYRPLTASAGLMTLSGDFGEYVPTIRTTYQAPSVSVGGTIKDFSTLISWFSISDSYPILDLDLQLNVTHPSLSDLSISVYGPGGSSKSGTGGITLVAYGELSGANLSNTTFDDEAAVPITAGVAPYSSRFRPDSPLGFFDNTSINGRWELDVSDGVKNRKTGTLNSWSLQVLRIDPSSGAQGPALATRSATISAPVGSTGGQGQQLVSLPQSGASLFLQDNSNPVPLVPAGEQDLTALATDLVRTSTRGTGANSHRSRPFPGQANARHGLTQVDQAGESIFARG